MGLLNLSGNYQELTPQYKILVLSLMASPNALGALESGQASWVGFQEGGFEGCDLPLFALNGNGETKYQFTLCGCGSGTYCDPWDTPSDDKFGVYAGYGAAEYAKALKEAQSDEEKNIARKEWCSMTGSYHNGEGNHTEDQGKLWVCLFKFLLGDGDRVEEEQDRRSHQKLGSEEYNRSSRKLERRTLERQEKVDKFWVEAEKHRQKVETYIAPSTPTIEQLEKALVEALKTEAELQSLIDKGQVTVLDRLHNNARLFILTDPMDGINNVTFFVKPGPPPKIPPIWPTSIPTDKNGHCQCLDHARQLQKEKTGDCSSSPGVNEEEVEEASDQQPSSNTSTGSEPSDNASDAYESSDNEESKNWDVSSSSGHSHASDIEPRDSDSDSEASNRREPSNENLVN